MDGGSATNSNSGGGSLGINGCSIADFKSSCCFSLTEATVLEGGAVPGGTVPDWSWPGKQKSQLILSTQNTD